MLTEDDLAFLRCLSVRRAYDDGEMVHERGDTVLSMGVVVQGRIKLVKPNSDGRETFVSFINAGQNYGDTLFSIHSQRTHRAMAIGATVIDHVPAEAFSSVLERPEIVKALYVVASYRVTAAIEMLDDLRTLAPDARLGKMLLIMQDKLGEGRRIDFLQEDFANLLGVSTMTVAKAFKALKSRNMIETGYRHVTLRDPQGLRQWLESAEAF